MKKISFRKIDAGEEKVFVNDIYIGSVLLDVWNSKWLCKPAFKSLGREVEFNENFYSAYKAGKAMVNLYAKIQNREKKTFDPFDDTEELLTKGLFDNIDP